MKTSNHLFEFEDQPWFPGIIRTGMMDYLQFLFSITNIYQPAAGLLSAAIKNTGDDKLVDLCSGGGGPWMEVQQELERSMHKKITVTLTDQYPNVDAFQHLNQLSAGRLKYVKQPVDATAVATQLKGFRTMFSAMHHFSKEMGAQVIRNAIKAKSGIGVFDGGDKNIFFVLLMIAAHSVGFLLFTPFIRPFSFARIFFTYIIPLIPLCTIWDGIVSITRLYTPAELLQMANASGDKSYEWRAGKVRNRLGLSIAYLVGYPANAV